MACVADSPSRRQNESSEGDGPVAELRTVELIPRVSIRLAVVARADPARFISAFVETWWRLPEYARSVLDAYWATDEAVVFLTTKWQGCEPQIAQCCADGRAFHFLSAAVDRLPDDVL